MTAHRLVPAGLGIYGLSTAVLGLVLVTGPGAASAPSGHGPAGRPPSAAPLYPAVVPAQSTPSPGAPAAGAVPAARVAGAEAAGAPFRPAELMLPGERPAPVTPVGVNPDGSLVVPDDPAVVGWWDGGALAGDAFGGVVLAGHVDSARFGIGVMARLRTLAAGDVVELRAPGRALRYRVTSSRSLPQAELVARTDAFRQDVSARLVLITCGGRFDPVRHRYEDNLVVYAEPVP